LLTHGRVILDHPKIATVSTSIVTVVEDISVLVALTKTVPEAENAKPAFGRTHATTRQKQLFRIGTPLMVMMALSILIQKITQAIKAITQAIMAITQAGGTQQKSKLRVVAIPQAVPVRAATINCPEDSSVAPD